MIALAVIGFIRKVEIVLVFSSRCWVPKGANWFYIQKHLNSFCSHTLLLKWLQQKVQRSTSTWRYW